MIKWMFVVLVLMQIGLIAYAASVIGQVSEVLIVCFLVTLMCAVFSWTRKTPD